MRWKTRNAQQRRRHLKYHISNTDLKTYRTRIATGLRGHKKMNQQRASVYGEKRIAWREGTHPERIFHENGDIMHTILKYTLGQDSEITMPMGSRILSVTGFEDQWNENVR
ncbi:hypothetical protein YL93_21680 [Salmonella enterica subsp. enterica serovar Montevideo]|nr:hypothetical protein [Salmonella enterica subsp. enterica serovar Montevideo]